MLRVGVALGAFAAGGAFSFVCLGAFSLGVAGLRTVVTLRASRLFSTTVVVSAGTHNASLNDFN